MDVSALRSEVEVAASAVIGEHCTLGYPKEARLQAAQADARSAGRGAPVVIGEGCLVANQVVAYEGVRFGAGCVVEDRVRIGYDTQVGARCRLVYGAYICDRVVIEDDARVGGFVCDAARIGARSTVMGALVHEYTRPHQDWWEVDEDPPVVEPDSVVGHGARVIGGVTVGPHSYVAAGALVTRDVPPKHIAINVNHLVPAAAWPGHRLASLTQAWTTPSSPAQ